MAAYSRISLRSQTVIPREIRERLGVKSGDRLRYGIVGSGVLIEKAEPAPPDEPFAALTEWASPEDDEAFADL